MFWRCKVCDEKSARIADLKTEIENLKKLVFPPSSSKIISLVDLERDKIMSGSSESIPVSQFDYEREASSLMTGTYEQSLQVEVE